jgi:hypothetical protein
MPAFDGRVPSKRAVRLIAGGEVMSKIVARLLALLAVVTTVPASAALCAPGTLQDYINLGSGGCQIGVTSYADFSLGTIPFGAIPIDPNAIAVTPTSLSIPDFQLLGLLFTVNLTATAGTLLDTLVHFDVSATSIAGARATLGGADATADGAVTLIEEMCLGGFFAGIEPVGCPTTTATLLPFAIEGFSDPDLSAAFPPATFLDVFADIGIDGGLAGTATLTSARLLFAVPAGILAEPSAPMLVLLGLAMLAAIRHRRPPHAVR